MASEIVEKVKESRWMKDGEMVTTYYVTLVDGMGEREVPCYSPMGKDLKEDTPLPDGWEVKTSAKGKLYLAAPKTAGQRTGGSFAKQSSWYNSEEGVRFTQERTDRRTALMQAVTLALHPDGGWAGVSEDLDELTELLYQILRKNLDVSALRETSSFRDTNPAVTGDGDRAERREPRSEASQSGRVGADTPSDGGGESQILGEAPPSPSTHATKWEPCHCGAEWGPNVTSSGKRICVRGHVERFDNG